MQPAHPPPPQIPRSAVLVGAAAALVACTGRRGRSPTPTATPRPSGTGPATGSAQPSADPAVIRLVTDAVAVEVALLTAYDSAIAALPRLRGILTAFRAHHSAHAEWLSMVLPGAPDPSLGPPGTPGPPDERRILRGLVAAEWQASRAGATTAGRAPTGELAVLLAEIAGSEAQHAVLLRTVRPRPRR